jgi:hypothetical protein
LNERIKQLWEEAAKTTQSDSWEEQAKFMERFAELIVRECVDVGIKDFYNHLPNIFPANAIKKHFGVEE